MCKPPSFTATSTRGKEHARLLDSFINTAVTMQARPPALARDSTGSSTLNSTGTSGSSSQTSSSASLSLPVEFWGFDPLESLPKEPLRPGTTTPGARPSAVGPNPRTASPVHGRGRSSLSARHSSSTKGSSGILDPLHQLADAASRVKKQSSTSQREHSLELPPTTAAGLSTSHSDHIGGTAEAVSRLAVRTGPAESTALPLRTQQRPQYQNDDRRKRAKP
jgi:hypothetical protein